MASSTRRATYCEGMGFMSARSPVWLYAHPSMEQLAASIVQRCGGALTPATLETLPEPAPTFQRQLSYRERRTVEFKKTIRWDKFPDGFPNLFIEDVKNMAGKDVIFLTSFHSPESIFEQLSVVYAIPRYLARSFTLILPYFPTGTMERVDTEGQIATAKTLATMLSSLPLTARGPAQIMLFDIHALQERFYFSDNIIPRLESAIPLLQLELEALQKKGENKISIAFPDDGAFKRFSNMFGGYETIVCAKIRNGDKRVVKVKDGDPAEHHCIIVDDLVQTGGTLIECARALLAGGATKVSAYATHGVFPKQSWKKFVDGDVKFDTFWITDSIPHAREICQAPRPFKLLSLCDVIADILLGYDLKQTN